MVTYELIDTDSPQDEIPVPLPGKTALPSMSGSEVRANLEAQRVQCLDQMVDEPDRAKRLTLLHTARALEVAIASLPSDQSQSTYGRFKRVREALKFYFQQTNRVAEREQIVDALVAGGLRRMPSANSAPSPDEITEHTKTLIRKSIAFHLVNPRGIEERVIRERNGKIGLWDWADERFQ